MLDLTQPEVSFVVEAVRRGAALARRVQAEMVLEGVAKQDLSPVTVGDYAVQAVVGHLLQERFPEDVLVGEEDAEGLRGDAGATMREAVHQFVSLELSGAGAEEVCEWVARGTGEPGRRFWTLDPIDGTKGYLRGGHYAIALALVEEGRVTLGALGCPHLVEDASGPEAGPGALLVARRGEGTWCTALGRADAPWTQAQVSAESDTARARILRSVEAGHTNVDETEAVARALGIEAEPVCMDSQAKYAVLAAGGAELLFRLMSPKHPNYQERIWDQAAGSIVLEEAGGRVTDLQGQPLDFSRGRTLAGNRGVFASNGPLHAVGLQALREVGASAS